MHALSLDRLLYQLQMIVQQYHQLSDRIARTRQHLAQRLAHQTDLPLYDRHEQCLLVLIISVDRAPTAPHSLCNSDHGRLLDSLLHKERVSHLDDALAHVLC